VAGPLIEPVAVEIALRPRRVAKWLGWSVLGWIALVMLFVVTIVGSPIAVLVLFAALLVGGVGYLAAGLIVGDRVARGLLNAELPSWQAVLIGIALFRLVRLVPYAGGVVHGLVVWVGFAAASALAWDKARSWHARRLPDKVQFRDENIIEWHPPEQGGGA
jgi:hypothetical protein